MVGQGTKDPADREFEALLAGDTSSESSATAETPPAGSLAGPARVSDEMFESLMSELGGLGQRATDRPRTRNSHNSTSDDKQSGDPVSSSLEPVQLSTVSQQMARLLDRVQPFRNRLAEITRRYAGDKSLRQFQADCDLLTINLQIAGLVGQTNHCMFVESASQAFSLPLEDVVEVLPAPARREYINNEWVLSWSGNRYPAFSLQDWWVSHQKDQVINAEYPLFVLIGRDAPVALLVDRCIGVSASATQPLGRLLSGSIGLKGISDSKEFGSALKIDIQALGAILTERSNNTGSTGWLAS